MNSGNPFPGFSGQTTPATGEGMTYGPTGLMIAFREADISTSSPDAKEQLKTGLSYLMQYNQPNESLRYFDEALAIDPAFGEAWLSKAVAYNNMGQYADAIACYDKALEIEPDNVAIWRMKGMTLQNSGKPDEAAECFRKETELS
jgi:tetratricopeptide (TPR) repeat protein